MILKLTDIESGNAEIYKEITDLTISPDKTFLPEHNTDINFDPYILRFRGRELYKDSVEDHTLYLSRYRGFELKLDDRETVKTKLNHLVIHPAHKMDVHNFYDIRLTKTKGISYRKNSNRNGFSITLNFECRGMKNDTAKIYGKDAAHVLASFVLFERVTDNDGDLIYPETDTTYTAKLDCQTRYKI